MSIKIEKDEINENIMKQGNIKSFTVEVKNGVSFEAETQYLKLQSDDSPTGFAIIYFTITPTDSSFLKEFELNKKYRMSFVGTYFNAKVKKKYKDHLLIEVLGYNDEQYDYKRKTEENIEFETK